MVNPEIIVKEVSMHFNQNILHICEKNHLVFTVYDAFS